MVFQKGSECMQCVHSTLHCGLSCVLLSESLSETVMLVVWRHVHVRVLLPSRQQGDGGGVGTGLTVSVMCSNTQMAADTTQIDSHAVLSHPLSLLPLLLLSGMDVLSPARIHALPSLPSLIDIQINAKKKMWSPLSFPGFHFLLFTPPRPSSASFFPSSSFTRRRCPGAKEAFWMRF